MRSFSPIMYALIIEAVLKVAIMGKFTISGSKFDGLKVLVSAKIFII